MKNEIQVIIRDTQTVTILTSDDVAKATSILSKLNKYLDELTNEKEKVTKPILLALKNERDRFRPIEQQLECAISKIRQELSTYQTRLLREQKESEQKIADKLSAGKIKVETALKRMGKVEKPETIVTVEGGTLKFRTDTVLRVLDIKKIPLEYFDLNESRLLRALKNGARMDGVYIEEVQTPVNYR